MPGHVAAGVGTQEHGEPLEVVRFAEAPQGDLRVGTFHRLGVVPQRFGEIGAHQPRADRVGTNALRAVFQCQVAHQADQRQLGGAVQTQCLGGFEGTDAGGEHHRAIAFFDHVRRHQTGQPQVGLHVHLHGFFVGVVGDFGNRPVMHVDAGVADQNVHRAGELVGFLHQRLQVLFAAGVGGHRVHTVRAHRFIDLGGGFVEGVLLARGDHHGGAVGGQRVRHRLAHALGGAGHQRHLAGQIEQCGIDHGSGSGLAVTVHFVAGDHIVVHFVRTVGEAQGALLHVHLGQR